MANIPEDQLARIRPVMDALHQQIAALLERLPDSADSAIRFHAEPDAE